MADIFFGTSSNVSDVHGTKRDNQFVNTHEDTIIQRGAPNHLLSDRGQAIISHKVKDILRAFCVNKWQVNHISTTKILSNNDTRPLIMLQTVFLIVLVHPHTYGYCLQYVCYLLNHMYNMTIDALPLTKLLGSTVDISPLRHFHFWECVYYHQSETYFPSDCKEGLGNILGISEHCGHALTYKALTADTGHVIYRSLLRPVTTADASLRASMFVGESDTHNEILKSRDDFSNVNMDEYKLADTPLPSPVFNPQDLSGR
jgi:hypothetical protein